MVETRVQDYRVDLYLRPPHIHAYKLMDFHLIDRIVRNSYRCAALQIVCGLEFTSAADSPHAWLQLHPSV